MFVFLLRICAVQLVYNNAHFVSKPWAVKMWHVTFVNIFANYY